MDIPAEMIGVHAIARRYIADALTQAYTESPEVLHEVMTERLMDDQVEGGQDA